MTSLRVEPYSFSRFIYPFQFTQGDYQGHIQAFTEASWKAREKSHHIWDKDYFPAEDLLPHVARYLNPPINTVDTAILMKIDPTFLRSAFGLAAGQNQGKVAWKLGFRHQTIPFEITDLRMCLFRTGIGFLILDVSPRSESLDVWLDFLHFFRFSKGQRDTTLDVEENLHPGIPYIPGIVKGKKPPLNISKIINAILATGSLPKDNSPWCTDIFIPGQLLSFSGLFLTGKIAASGRDLLVYRVRNFHHSRQELDLVEEGVDQDKKWLLPYAHNQWFHFSIEGGGFLAINPPQTQFIKTVLPDHLRKQYYLLYLLALNQRFTLNCLSDEIADHWLTQQDNDNAGREQIFRNIRDAFLSFNARGYFAQVMQREHHHAVYTRWLEVLQINRLYQDVHMELSDMYEYLMMQKSERLQQLAEAERQHAAQEAQENQKREKAAKERAEKLERLLSMIAWILGLPLLGLTFQLSAFGENWKLAVLFVVISLLIGFAIYLSLRQRYSDLHK